MCESIIIIIFISIIIIIIISIIIIMYYYYWYTIECGNARGFCILNMSAELLKQRCQMTFDFSWTIKHNQSNLSIEFDPINEPIKLLCVCTMHTYITNRTISRQHV